MARSTARFSPTERIGTNAVEGIFIQFGWIPRSQEQSDMGIDSQVEVCDQGNPTGKLLALQVKCGESYFSEVVGNSIVYRGTKEHYDYWTNHSLPVIVILHNPITNETIWQHIIGENIKFTKKAWKTHIDRSQTLSKDQAQTLSSIAEGPRSLVKLRRLRLDRPLLLRIESGETLVLRIEEWVSKPTARIQLSICSVDPQGVEQKIQHTGYFYRGHTLEEMLVMVFPWAEFSIDHNFYLNALDEDSVTNLFGNLDRQTMLYPYEVLCGEVANYRLSIDLNKLGGSFLVLDDYLSS